MKSAFFLMILSIQFVAVAQPPVIYINFVSHNEPGDNLHTVLNYNAMEAKVLQMADIIDAEGASWNLETCDGFVKGALDWDGAASNVFKTLATAPYGDNIEIDPRQKQTIYPNIADLYHMLDSVGANPTNTLGGFVYSTTNEGIAPLDWFEYQDTIYSAGAGYPTVKWKCEIIWGAGSYPPHSNDLNDWGIFKPDTATTTDTFNDFYLNNPARSLYYVGNGCQPLQGLDSTEDEQIIITGLKTFIDSVQAGLLPQDRFYVYSVTVNQAHFGPTQYQQVQNICDSVNSWGTSKIQWARLTDKLDLFKVWQISEGLDSSQWNCGDEWTAGLEDPTPPSEFVVYPNPARSEINVRFDDDQSHSLTLLNMIGEEVLTSNGNSMDVSELRRGMYVVRVDNKFYRKILVE